jgi:hypothetical protein
MQRGRGYRDKPPIATPVHVLVFNRILRRGLLLDSGIVVRPHSVDSSLNVPHFSHRVATNVHHSRMGIKCSVRVLPTTLLQRLVLPILPTGVSVVEKKVTCLTIARRSLTSRLPRDRAATRSPHLTREG